MRTRGALLVLIMILPGLTLSGGDLGAQNFPAGTSETTDELVARAERAKRAPCDRAAYQAVLDKFRQDLENASQKVSELEQSIADALREIEGLESEGVVVGPLLSSLRGASTPAEASSIAERAARQAGNAAKKGYGGPAQDRLMSLLAKLTVDYRFLPYWQERCAKLQQAIETLEAAPWECEPQGEQPAGTTPQPGQGRLAGPTSSAGEGTAADTEPAIPSPPGSFTLRIGWPRNARSAADRIFERAKTAKQECRKEDYERERAKLVQGLDRISEVVEDSADGIDDEIDDFIDDLSTLDPERTQNLREDLNETKSYEEDLAAVRRAWEGMKTVNKANLGGPNGAELEGLLDQLHQRLESYILWFRNVTGVQRHIMRLLDELNRMPMVCPPQRSTGSSTTPPVPGGGTSGTVPSPARTEAPAPAGSGPGPGGASPQKAPSTDAQPVPKPDGQTGYVPGAGSAQAAQYPATLPGGITLAVSPVIARAKVPTLGFGTVIPPGAAFGTEPFAAKSARNIDIYGGFGSVGVPLDWTLPWNWSAPRLSLVGGAASGSEGTRDAITGQSVALTYQTMFPGSTGLFVGVNNLFIDTRTQVDTYKIGASLESTRALSERLAWEKSAGFYFGRFEQQVTADMDMPDLFGAPGFSIDGRSRNELETSYYMFNITDRLIYSPRQEISLYASGGFGLGYYDAEYRMSERIHCIPCAGGPEENTRFSANKDKGGFAWEAGLGVGAIYRPAPNIALHAGLDFFYLDKVAEGQRRANPAEDPVDLGTRHMWTRAITLGVRLSF